MDRFVTRGKKKQPIEGINTRVLIVLVVYLAVVHLAFDEVGLDTTLGESLGSAGPRRATTNHSDPAEGSRWEQGNVRKRIQEKWACAMTNRKVSSSFGANLWD